MYGVEGGLDNAQLEEQGRKDWSARGFDAEEFTMARMTQIWNTEETAKQREAENKNKLQEKLAKIQRQKERDFIPSKKQLGDLVKDSWTNLKVGTKATITRARHCCKDSSRTLPACLTSWRQHFGLLGEGRLG